VFVSKHVASTWINQDYVAQSPKHNAVEPEPEMTHLDTKGNIAKLRRIVA